MPNMDVTPRELRDIDIRERLGGYNKDDVDDLLERAAARIEGLEGQLRVAQSQAEAGAGHAGKTRETEDMLHRTLLLAQRAADEAVAEAQAKARQILDDAENKSRSMVSEAETNARRQAETERRRLEGEVLELGAKREALVADVDGLERFETDYRGRLRRAVEADLEMLSAKGSVAPSPRPTIHDVEMPAASAPNITTEWSPCPHRRRRHRSATARGAVAGPPQTPQPPSTAPALRRPAIDARPLDLPAAHRRRSFPPPSASPGAGLARRRPLRRGKKRRRPPIARRRSSGGSRGPEPLDDDAFFASLRRP